MNSCGSDDQMTTRLAILNRPLRGKFTRWRKGEIVKAHHVIGSSYCIEKLKRKRAGILKMGLPLANELAGVPRSALKFLGCQPA